LTPMVSVHSMKTPVRKAVCHHQTLSAMKTGQSVLIGRAANEQESTQKKATPQTQ
jgi:hypothetical protein